MEIVHEDEVRRTTQTGFEKAKLGKLVEELSAPLSAMRTLASMLVTQLQPEEPKADLVRGMLEESVRLKFLSSQLQVALYPPLLEGTSGPDEDRGQLPETASGGDDGVGSAAVALVRPTTIVSSAVESHQEFSRLREILDPLLREVQIAVPGLKVRVSWYGQRDIVYGNPWAVRRALSSVLDSALCESTEGTVVNLKIYCDDYTQEAGIRMQLRFSDGPRAHGEGPQMSAGGGGRGGASSLATFGVELSKNQIENLGGSVLTKEGQGIDIELPSSAA